MENHISVIIMPAITKLYIIIAAGIIIGAPTRITVAVIIKKKLD